MKPLIWTAFAAAVIAQWAVPLVGVRKHERTLAEGAPVRIRCQAPDPYDMLRGRYLAVRLQPDTIPRPEALKDRQLERGQTLYLLLEKDADGLHTATTAVLERPGGDAPFVKARLSWGEWAGSDTIGIEWPVDRFYLNEKVAPEADRWYAETVRGKDGVIADLRLLDGRLVIEDLTYQGTPFREILKNAGNGG